MGLPSPFCPRCFPLYTILHQHQHQHQLHVCIFCILCISAPVRTSVSVPVSVVFFRLVVFVSATPSPSSPPSPLPQQRYPNTPFAPANPSPPSSSRHLAPYHRFNTTCTTRRLFHAHLGSSSPVTRSAPLTRNDWARIRPPTCSPDEANRALSGPSLLYAVPPAVWLAANHEPGGIHTYTLNGHAHEMLLLYSPSPRCPDEMRGFFPSLSCPRRSCSTPLPATIFWPSVRSPSRDVAQRTCDIMLSLSLYLSPRRDASLESLSLSPPVRLGTATPPHPPYRDLVT